MSRDETQPELNDFHAIGGKEGTILEDERQYGDFDVGDSVGSNIDLDAGGIHDEIGRDAGIDPDIGSGKGDGDNYGGEYGENGEYDDIVIPEDDDGQFGDALPDELCRSQGDEGDREIGDPVDVGSTQAIFPGSDEW